MFYDANCECEMENQSEVEIPIQSLIKGVTVSRLTVPNDANVYGNVHGGTTLKLLEEAGIIISSKFCNYASKKGSPKMYTSLVRIENVDFMQPMKIGEVVELTGEILFTSTNSILVEVIVVAEDIIRAIKRTTIRAHLWYVAYDDREQMTEVPQLGSLYLRGESESRYGPYIKGNPIIANSHLLKPGKSSPVQSISSAADPKCYCHIEKNSPKHTPSFSETCLSMMVGSNDVVFGGKLCKGGVLLKLMDECAGIVAAKHCNTNVVTACMDATNFYDKIRIGQLLTIHGKCTYTSNKSMEVEVEVFVEDPFSNNSRLPFKAADAFFTYVSMGLNGKTKSIPPLVVSTDEERSRFEEGSVRYNIRKENRLKMNKV